MEVIEKGRTHHDKVSQTKGPQGQFSKSNIGSRCSEKMLSNAFPFSEQQPVIVVIEDGWHGYLEVSLFQWHEGKETSVEEKVEFHKPAMD